MDLKGYGEDSESSKACRDDIIAMLTASGYHRARVGSLNYYDRIVGGIAWAITRLHDVAVQVDLLYEESEENQNIKLRTEQSEKIIEALDAVNCPHRISAHQLFGLDFFALKILVQWLLRRLHQRKAPKNQANVISWVTRRPKASEDKNEVKLTTSRFRRPAVTRQLKRLDSSMKFSLGMDAKCTLAEYSGERRDGEDVEIQRRGGEEEENLKEATTKKHVPTSMVREMMDQAVVEDSEDVNVEKTLPQKIAEMKTKIASESEALKILEQENQQLSSSYEHILERLESDEVNLDEITNLMKSYATTKTRAEELHLQMLQELENSESDIDDLEDLIKNREAIQEKFDAKTAEFAEACREVMALQLELDTANGAALAAHYRKRNMERILDSMKLTQAAKVAVIDFNVTCDILTFGKRITGFMDEVERSLLAEPLSQEHRDAFVSYMNGVRTQLGEYHWKAKLQQDKHVTDKMGLSQIRTVLRTKEREVDNTAAEMRKLLALNRTLQKTAARLARE